MFLFLILQEILVSPDAKPRHSYRVAQQIGLPSLLSLTENRLSESGDTHTLTAQQKNTADVNGFPASHGSARPCACIAFSHLPKNKISHIPCPIPKTKECARDQLPSTESRAATSSLTPGPVAMDTTGQ